MLTAWSPVLTIKSALLSLEPPLTLPHLRNPQNARAASMLMDHPEQFDNVARQWAVGHAGAPVKLLRADGASYTYSPLLEPKEAEQIAYQVPGFYVPLKVQEFPKQ